MYFLSVSLLLVFAIGSAVAQSSSTASAAVPTSTAGIDPCILGCVQSAASSNGCSSFTDLSCVCGSTAFQQSALSCLQSNCTSADVQAAQALQSAECAAVSASSSIASVTSGASSGLSSATSAISSISSSLSSAASSLSSAAHSASSASASASKSASAGTPATTLDRHALLGIAMAVMGVMIGARMVL